jgi:hypothetical protein
MRSNLCPKKYPRPIKEWGIYHTNQLRNKSKEGIVREPPLTEFIISQFVSGQAPIMVSIILFFTQKVNGKLD